MSNVHIQTAATNLRRASDDFKASMDKVQADANKQKREMEKQIDHLKQEQNILEAKVRSGGDDQGKAEALLLNRKVGGDISELEKSVHNLQDQTRQQIDSMDRQMNDFNNLAQKLESSA